MKRTLVFQSNDQKYVCVENGVSIFEIDKTDLKFDVKKFYYSFFSEGNDFSEIDVTVLMSCHQAAHTNCHRIA